MKHLLVPDRALRLVDESDTIAMLRSSKTADPTVESWRLQMSKSAPRDDHCFALFRRARNTSSAYEHVHGRYSYLRNPSRCRLTCACSAEKGPSSAAAAAAALAADTAGATPGEKEDLSGVAGLEDMFDPRGPVSVLLDLAEKEAKAEEDRGVDARSPLLQALVQVSFGLFV